MKQTARSALLVVERPAGDSPITVFSAQQFWDPRGCASNTIEPRGPKAR